MNWYQMDSSFSFLRYLTRDGGSRASSRMMKARSHLNVLLDSSVWRKISREIILLDLIRAIDSWYVLLNSHDWFS